MNNKYYINAIYSLLWAIFLMLTIDTIKELPEIIIIWDKIMILLGLFISMINYVVAKYNE